VAPSTARIETLESLREHLQWAIAEALEMFLRLEQPAPPGAPAEGDGYETIGQGEGKARGEVWDGVTKPKAVESEVARLISKAQPKQQGGNRQAVRGSVEFYQSFKKW
jgi:hypothetical protein